MGYEHSKTIFSGAIIVNEKNAVENWLIGKIWFWWGNHFNHLFGGL